MTPRTITIGPGDVRRKHYETACDDCDVMLDPGVYTLRFLTVDGRETAPESAYWETAQIPGTRIRDGARFGKAGDRETYHYQTWAGGLVSRGTK